MKRSAPTILSLILIMVVSSNVFAGNIAGGRSAGNIAGGRTSGNIAGGRANGNIAGGRASTAYLPPSITESANGPSRLNVETALSGTFAGLIRMLLESGALL